MNTPLNISELSAFLRQYLNLSIASRPLIEGHQAPLDYLAHVFFQGRGGFGAHGLALPPDRLDSVVWASRGGGKTFLGAVATALDLVFKPGIDIRILGGSLDQSRKMHGYLKQLFAKEPLADLVDGRISDSRLALTNGSVVELLAQSHTAVRGTRVQTLRCDEVELFKQDVFDAAMLVTTSKTIDIPGVGPTTIAGSIECMSTMHVPFGLMSRLVKDEARLVFKWGVVDVLAECEQTRQCGSCALWNECGGKAKEAMHSPQRHGDTEKKCGVRSSECGVGNKRGTRNSERGAKGRKPRGGKGSVRVMGRRDLAVRARRAARDAASKRRSKARGVAKTSRVRADTRVSPVISTSSPDAAARSTRPVAALAARTVSERTAGHLSVDDALRMKRRVSLPVWNTEMLCLEPSRADTVFPEFDRAKHVFGMWDGEAGMQEMDSSPLEWLDPLRPVLIESVFRPAPSTFVCGIDFGFRAPTVILWSALDKHGVLRILDERHVTRETTKQHAAAILRGNGRYWRVPDWIGADPAGKQRQSQSGKSDVQVLQESGLAVKTRGSEIVEGLNLIRERLSSADGTVRLLVHARCHKLIEAFVQYHYRVDDPEDQNPVKDGHDHAIDALRYLLLNLEAKEVRVSWYA